MAPLYGDEQLVGADFIDHLAVVSPALARDFASELRNVLLDDEALLPLVTDFEQRGSGGVGSTKALLQSHRFAFKTRSSSIQVPAT